MVQSVHAGGEIIIIRLFRVQDRADGVQAGVADRSLGQTGILVGVIGAVEVDGKALALEHRAVVDRGVHAEQRILPVL